MQFSKNSRIERLVIVGKEVGMEYCGKHRTGAQFYHVYYLIMGVVFHKKKWTFQIEIQKIIYSK